MISKLQYISQGSNPKEHLENIQKACSAGADWVQLRLKDLDEEVVLETAEKAREITSHFQTRLIINDYYKIAKQVKADGVHLGKTDTCPLEARAYLGKLFIVGGTANTFDDCKKLLEKEVDYIGLGPFQFTDTKANLSPVLGAVGYKHIVDKLQTSTPIIAIGGISIDHVSDIMDSGVYGVAVSKEITSDFNKIAAFNQLLKAPATQEQVYKMNT